MKTLTFKTEITSNDQFIELDHNEARHELYLDFEKKTASVVWVHQSSYASMGMDEYNRMGQSFTLPGAVKAEAVKDFIEELDASLLFDEAHYDSAWDGSNWKGSKSEELDEWLEGVGESVSDLEEFEISDWSENSTRNTASLVADAECEVTPFTTDEQLREIQAHCEGDDDVIYQGVYSALEELRDALKENADYYDAKETLEEARAFAASEKSGDVEIWDTKIGFVVLEAGEGVLPEDAELFGHGTGRIEQSLSAAELRELKSELANA